MIIDFNNLKYIKKIALSNLLIKKKKFSQIY